MQQTGGGGFRRPFWEKCGIQQRNCDKMTITRLWPEDERNDEHCDR